MVDRKRLVRVINEKGVREILVGRCEKVLRETKGRVRVEEREVNDFWIGRGVRQGCLLSPTLFTLLLADLKEEMRRGRWGEVRLETEKMYTLGYADDLAVMAENEEETRRLMARLERYVEEKGLEIITSKTKSMRCRKGRRKKDKMDVERVGN